MANKQPYTWQPEEHITVTNVSAENVLLELNSGPLRLDIGRTLRLTTSALESPQVMGLLNAGKLKIVEYRSRKGITDRLLDELHNA